MKNLKYLLLTFCSLLFIDQIIKWFVVKYNISSTSFLFNFQPTINVGVIFGNLSNADPLLRTIFFATFFILVLFIAVVVLVYFLRAERFKKLSLSLTIFVAGISGNAIDRIRLGYAIDYIHLPWTLSADYIFNFADLVQLTGIILTIFFLFRLNNQLWPENNEREMNLVDTKFQLGFSFKLSLISFFSLLMMGTFAYVFFKVYLPVFDNRLQNVFLLSWLVIGILLMSCTFLFGIILSGRSIGPIVAFERFVSSLKKGEDVTLKLREMDSFKQLESIARDIRDLINKK